MRARGWRKRTEKERASACARNYLRVRRIDRGKTGSVQASATRREKAGPSWRGTRALGEAEQAHGAGAHAAWLGHIYYILKAQYGVLK
jgi:hypothetical protein